VPELTEAERQCLTETQSLTRDEAGRDVLVGLTYEESSLLMVYRRQFAMGNRDLDPIKLSIWLELSNRHALARPRPDNLTQLRLTESRASSRSTTQLCGSWCGGNLLEPLP
jgi:hypothetical protein